jgi:hypothetical protein
MNKALPLADPADPNLPVVVARNLKRAGIPPEWESTVVRLSTGAMKPKMLVCCGSGCSPCVQDILRCAAGSLRDLEAGHVAPDPSGLRERVRLKAGKVGKGLLRRAKGRLKG